MCTKKSDWYERFDAIRVQGRLLRHEYFTTKHPKMVLDKAALELTIANAVELSSVAPAGAGTFLAGFQRVLSFVVFTNSALFLWFYLGHWERMNPEFYTGTRAPWSHGSQPGYGPHRQGPAAVDTRWTVQAGAAGAPRGAGAVRGHGPRLQVRDQRTVRRASWRRKGSVCKEG